MFVKGAVRQIKTGNIHARLISRCIMVAEPVAGPIVQIILVRRAEIPGAFHKLLDTTKY